MFSDPIVYLEKFMSKAAIQKRKGNIIKRLCCNLNDNQNSDFFSVGYLYSWTVEQLVKDC